jgi:8-oxo-dGTP pyrophosphatase MutT (NUDIX family)
MSVLPKVTAFVVRPSPAGGDLLLFRHPYAGVQIPAGWVDEGAAPQHAVLREVAEETGLTDVHLLDEGALPEIVFPQDRWLDVLWAAGARAPGASQATRRPEEQDLPDGQG